MTYNRKESGAGLYNISIIILVIYFIFQVFSMFSALSRTEELMQKSEAAKVKLEELEASHAHSRGKIAPKKNTLSVVVASQDIKAGSRIRQEYLKIIEMPQTEVKHDAAAYMLSLIGRRVKVDIKKDQPVTFSVISKRSEL